MDAIINFLSDTSKNKLDKFYSRDQKIGLNKNLKSLIDNMVNAFKREVEIINTDAINLEHIRTIFKDFDKDFNNVVGSKFSKDLYNMKDIISLDLVIHKSVIRVNIISHGKPNNLISAILHALNTFCYFFPYDYDGLEIYISLDSNCREFKIDKITNIWKNGPKEVFKYLQKHSSAFTVSGLTKRKNKIVLLTKREDIIKLLFHEMVHYIGLDDALVMIQNGNFGLCISKPNLNLSEAYAEFMSILLNAAYHSIHLAGILQIDLYDIYGTLLGIETEYSVYLSANILRFYRYDKNNFKNFFTIDNSIPNRSHICPIPIWEYIIIRTQLLLNIYDVTNIVGNPSTQVHNGSWNITEDNIRDVIRLMKINSRFIRKLEIFFEKTAMTNNISYTMINFNWNSLP